jgi:hypothetical protein
MIKDQKKYCLLVREGEGEQGFDMEQARFTEVPSSFKHKASFITKPDLLDHLIHYLNWSLLLKKDDSESQLFYGLLSDLFQSIAVSLVYTKSGWNVMFNCPILPFKLFMDYASAHIRECLERTKRMVDLQMNS